MRETREYVSSWTEERLGAFESAHPDGIAVQQIIDAFEQSGERLTEATFRKYVQLGLLPRSVRVGRKGKHRGSQGLYPAMVVRRIDTIRRLMSQGYTIEEIQRELLLRGDIDELHRCLARVWAALSQLSTRDDHVVQQISEAKAAGESLLILLSGIEESVSLRSRMKRAMV